MGADLAGVRKGSTGCLGTEPTEENSGPWRAVEMLWGLIGLTTLPSLLIPTLPPSQACGEALIGFAAWPSKLCMNSSLLT